MARVPDCRRSCQFLDDRFNNLLKSVMSAGQTRQNPTKKRSLLVINEHFEQDFNAVWPSIIVFQQPVQEGPDFESISFTSFFIDPVWGLETGMSKASGRLRNLSRQAFSRWAVDFSQGRSISPADINTW